MNTTDQAAPGTFPVQPSYTLDELLAHANGEYGDDLPRLPLPPMLMLHRITSISNVGGAHEKGFAEAQYDVTPESWFFPVHFKGKPIMPGCLGIDACWQLGGFLLGWLGARGDGMATGIGEVRLRGMILPDTSIVRIRVDVEQFRISQKLSSIRLNAQVSRGHEPKPVYELQGITIVVAPKKAA